MWWQNRLTWTLIMTFQLNSSTKWFRSHKGFHGNATISIKTNLLSSFPPIMPKINNSLITKRPFLHFIIIWLKRNRTIKSQHKIIKILCQLSQKISFQEKGTNKLFFQQMINSTVYQKSQISWQVSILTNKYLLLLSKTQFHSLLQIKLQLSNI